MGSSSVDSNGDMPLWIMSAAAVRVLANVVQSELRRSGLFASAGKCSAEGGESGSMAAA